MIRPEPGRHVHYIPAGVNDYDMAIASGQPLAAIVTGVHGDRMVNLAVFDANGKHFTRASITLVQPGDEPPNSGPHCRWMPYTVESAAKQQKA